MFFMNSGLFIGMFVVVFLLILGAFLFAIIKGIGQWHKNNNSPRLTVDATVVAKREDVSHHYHSDAGNGAGYTTTSTNYYVTFQVESGDRMELTMGGNDYGMLAQGDRGRLSFQGTRYLGFFRI